MSDASLNAYKGKNIFITGHTGFKGSWLGWWLAQLGASVTGYALEPTQSSGYHFSSTGLGEAINSVTGDILDSAHLMQTMQQAKPEVVFHLAAQPIVLAGYERPFETFQTNIMGSASVLEAVRTCPSVKAVVMVTTDKCYADQAWDWPYRENDRLGGHDPYAASKAAVELVIRSYYQSFFEHKKIGVATARAGNVIGGGDLADHRLIPDIVRAVQNGTTITLRNPSATRPWQHVLDVLAGYLVLGTALVDNPIRHSEPYNFSPAEKLLPTVQDMTLKFVDQLVSGKKKPSIQVEEPKHQETNVLRLDSSKARERLGWKSQLSFEDSLRWTADWYKKVYQKPNQAQKITLDQIEKYQKQHEK